MIRTRKKTVTFRNSFVLGQSPEVLPPGNYDVETDEELLEGASFQAFRQVSALLHLPRKSGVERTLIIDPTELDEALRRDQSLAKAEGGGTDDGNRLQELTAPRQVDVEHRDKERGEENEAMI